MPWDILGTQGTPWHSNSNHLKNSSENSSGPRGQRRGTEAQRVPKSSAVHGWQRCCAQRWSISAARFTQGVRCCHFKCCKRQILFSFYIVDLHYDHDKRNLNRIIVLKENLVDASHALNISGASLARKKVINQAPDQHDHPWSTLVLQPSTFRMFRGTLWYQNLRKGNWGHGEGWGVGAAVHPHFRRPGTAPHWPRESLDVGSLWNAKEKFACEQRRGDL